LPKIVAAAHALGLDQISFLAADVSSEAFNRPTPWSGERASDVALTRDELPDFELVLSELIANNARDIATGFIAENPTKLRHLLTYYAAINGRGEFPPTTCNAPWVSTVVEADGTVRPCFFHRSLGNIHDAPLRQILNSPDSIQFRQTLDVRTDPICRKCVCTLRLGARTPV
jgi:MoaA/NifB/PqqE/SkfB family radical SAM enzyme